MFPALLVYSQEVLHKWHLVYCVHIMSVGCATDAVELQPWQSQLTLHAHNIPNVACATPPEDKQVMLKT
jgi:hypothetical protein